MSKEKKIAVCYKHWTAFFPQGLVAAVFLLFSAASAVQKDMPKPVAIGCLAVSLLVILYIFVSYKSDYIALTETRIIGHQGFFNSRTISTPLSKVQTIGIENGLGGKLLRYHTITVNNAGTDGTEFIFKRMAKARQFVATAQEKLQ